MEMLRSVETAFVHDISNPYGVKQSGMLSPAESSAFSTPSRSYSDMDAGAGSYSGVPEQSLCHLTVSLVGAGNKPDEGRGTLRERLARSKLSGKSQSQLRIKQVLKSPPRQVSPQSSDFTNQSSSSGTPPKMSPPGVVSAKTNDEKSIAQPETIPSGGRISEDRTSHETFNRIPQHSIVTPDSARKLPAPMDRRVLSADSVEEWTVENVTARVNKALRGLQNFAAPYISTTEAIDTSGESNSEAELDMNELVNELRSHKRGSQNSQADSLSSQELLVRSLSFEGVGKTSQSIMDNYIDAEEASLTLYPDETGAFASIQTSKTLGAANPSRAVTPMARMRLGDTGPEEYQKSRSTLKYTPDTDEDVIASKQRQWKTKLKHTENVKEGEQRILGENKAAKSKKEKVKGRKRHDVDPSPRCETGMYEFFDKVLGVHCGKIDDAIYGESEDMESAEGLESEAESEGEGPDLDRRLADSRGPPEQHSEPKKAEVNLNTPNIKGNSEKIGIHDKNFIRAFISWTSTKGITLFIHRMQRKHKNDFPEPLKVRAFIRPGVKDANGSYSVPRLAWDAEDGVEFDAMYLFEIKSIEKVPALQLKQYPFAMPGRSLVIRMSRGKDHVVETTTEEAAIRFLHGLRWTIARLSFNLIAGKVHGGCELLRLSDSKEFHPEMAYEGPANPLEGNQWTNAMNDVTNHLVDHLALH